MSIKSIADNADYVAAQISFLDDSGNVRSDCVCRYVPVCYICKESIIPSSSFVAYHLVFGKPHRICKVCYENYKQTFDIRFCRKASRRGGK